MSNEYENEKFDKAVRLAGVSGKDWERNEAVNVCSTDFHNAFSRDERKGMSFQEIVEWAENWWQENGHKYS